MQSFYRASYTIKRDQFSQGHILPYSDKRKQLLKMTFLINEQNVSVMYIDISAIKLSWCLDLNIFQQDECFCSKLGLEVEHGKPNLKTSLLSDLGDLSLASFCHSKAVLFSTKHYIALFWQVFVKFNTLALILNDGVYTKKKPVPYLTTYM